MFEQINVGGAEPMTISDDIPFMIVCPTPLVAALFMVGFVYEFSIQMGKFKL